MMPEKLVDVPLKCDFSKGIEMNPNKLEPAIHGGDGTAYIDHCFAEWDQKAEIIWQDIGAKLSMEADSIFKHFVVFMPSNNNFFCAEPVTNATDGFNLMAKGYKDTGTIILDHNQSFNGQVIFEATF